MREKILEAIQTALKETKKVKVKFKSEKKTDTATYLLKMRYAALISLDYDEERKVRDVMQRDKWSDYSKNITIAFTSTFDAEMFLDLLEDAIEDIEAVK